MEVKIGLRACGLLDNLRVEPASIPPSFARVSRVVPSESNFRHIICDLEEIR